MDPQIIVSVILIHTALAILALKTIGIDQNKFISDSVLVISIGLLFINLEVLRQKWNFIDWQCHLKNTGLYMLSIVLGLLLFEILFGNAIQYASWTFAIIKIIFIMVPGVLWYVFRDKIYYDPCSVYERQLNIS